MLTRKYYRLIAQCIKDNSVEVVDETTQDGETREYINKDNFIYSLSIELKKDNSNFNNYTFVEACSDWEGRDCVAIEPHLFSGAFLFVVVPYLWRL